jgi:hypothetical protein
MKSMYIKIAFCLTFAFGLSSCDKYFDINNSPNAAADVPNLGLVLADIVGTTSFNLVGGGNFSRYTAQWMQHVASNATPPSNDTYRFTTADFNNEWAFASYTSVLLNSKYVIEKGTAIQAWNHVAVAKILTAHNYAMLTDFFGDIPFSEALQKTGNLKPKYDTQAQVYTAIQALLDEAIADIDKASPLAVGTADHFLQGNMAKWKKVAYTLKARYHLRLSNAPGKDAVAQANLAIAALANGITATADDPKLTYPGTVGAEAPWNQWIAKFATTIQSGKFFVDLLVAKNDPRIGFLVDPAANTGTYVGYPNGTTTAIVLGDISNVGVSFRAANASVYVTSYIEHKFLEAEANFRAGNTTAAATAYEIAIKAHMARLSATITATQQNDYIAANPISMENIIVQKYIAGFVVASQEAYHDYRRTGFPNTIQPAQNADFNQIPTRIPYPDTEINNNLDNVPTGITPTSKVWWDAN